MFSIEVLINILKTSARVISDIGYFILRFPFSFVDVVKTLVLSLRSKLFPSRSPKKAVKKVKARRHLKRKVVKRILISKPVVFLYGVMFAIIFIGVPIIMVSWFSQLPSPDLLVEKGNNRSTKILDRKGRLLYEIYVDRKYNPVDLTEVPPHLVQATLAIEDDKFYDHNGFRIQSMVRALKAIILEDELQGGSTITQQLVKNVLLSPERTIPRKVKELVLSIMVEVKYSKDEILELYLNNTPYGGTAWGVEAASMKYYGKHVSEISLAEASMLAGLPSAPTAYSPVLSESTYSKDRQLQVLNRMVELGYINEEQKNSAYDEKLSYVPQVEYIKAPHFVAYVRENLERNLGSRYVSFGGLTVTTTLDLDLQDKVQEMVTSGVAANEWLQISNGAAVVLDSATGEILAYVGSVDYFQEGWGAYDVVTAYRQPGSSIKPVTYALAFENGYTAANILEDSPVRFASTSEVYRPVNYDGRFHGRVSIRQALANSYNIPAVKLLNKIGAHNMVALGKDMGLKGWEVGDDYGLSVTLGGKEVRLLDLANVFATFARKGMYKEPVSILYVEDARGYKSELSGVAEKRVLSEESSFLISSILSDNYARTPAFGSRSSLVIPGHMVAVKTGTTDLKRDNWTLGYTPSYTVGVWVGNNDNTAMNPNLASGLSGAAPIWNSIMTEILKEKANEPFDKPEGIFSKTDEKCNVTEYFARGSNIPGSLCVLAEEEEEKNKEKDKEKDND